MEKIDIIGKQALGKVHLSALHELGKMIHDNRHDVKFHIMVKLRENYDL